MLSIYNKLTDNNITLRDEEAIKRYVDLIQWGRKNPVQFIEKVLQVPLMDYQKYIISMTWTAEYAVWVCSRNAGKSFLVGCFMMARSLLYPKTKIHILSSGSRQANETFETMETIALNNVKTLISTNSVFRDEVLISKADSNGFSHDIKKGSNVSLLNGSFIRAVTGSPKTVRGKRSNVNVYDEAGSISREFYDVTEPFCTQSSGFKTGSNYDSEVYPEEVPNTRLYIGSASDTNSLFWDKYKEAFKQMVIGNRKYFVVDLNCEIPLHPTMNGKETAPLLSQDEIDRKMRENEIIALREYYNIFDRFDLEDSVVSRSDIYTNTENFVPSVAWGGKKHKYVITYDPASKNDNAPVLITEYYKTDEGRIEGRFVNMENLVITYGDGSKRPMRLDEQTQRLREIIYEYNGKDNIAPYENIMLLLDSGVGGQAPAIAQELVKPWTDKNGKVHPGLYDENSDDMIRWSEKFPTAVAGSMKLIEPTKYRNKMFEAARIMTSSGYVKFAPACPKTNVLVDDDGNEQKLSKAEMNALIQMDLMKEEAVSMVRTRTKGGNVTYGLTPERKNKMNDDRNYCFIMSCWYIQQLNIDDTLGEDEELDYKNKFFGSSNQTKQSAENSGWSGMFSGKKKTGLSPFGGKNPFGR